MLSFNQHNFPVCLFIYLFTNDDFHTYIAITWSRSSQMSWLANVHCVFHVMVCNVYYLKKHTNSKALLTLSPPLRCVCGPAVVCVCVCGCGCVGLTDVWVLVFKWSKLPAALQHLLRVWPFNCERLPLHTHTHTPLHYPSLTSQGLTALTHHPTILLWPYRIRLHTHTQPHYPSPTSQGLIPPSFSLSL